jgi:hypothetical protein
MEGAENFDFFRQPDFVPDKFLKGSYAVYKKETLVGEGTGKLCHIHRPEIIDARGRRCWGDLAVTGNELRITIPERFLSGAKYPIIVDPTIGTTTVGSFDKYWTGDSYDEEEDEWYSNYSILRGFDKIFLNKILIPESIGEMGTFYIYKLKDDSRDPIRRSYPVMYNNINNLPNSRISNNEQEIINPFGLGAQGWLQASLSKNCDINAGDYIWLGLRLNNIKMPFDFGGVFEDIDVWRSYYYGNTMIPDVIWDYNNYSVTTKYNREIKASMYLTYEPSAKNYIKTIVQGVTVSDTRKSKVVFNRIMFQSLKVTTSFSKTQDFLRQCVMCVATSIPEIIQLGLGMIRNCKENAAVNGEAVPRAQFCRKESDMVQAVGFAIRHLHIFIRILAKLFMRDYFIGRFLIAREELVLKSCVVREIVIESRIN